MRFGGVLTGIGVIGYWLSGRSSSPAKKNPGKFPRCWKVKSGLAVEWPPGYRTFVGRKFSNWAKSQRPSPDKLRIALDFSREQINPPQEASIR